MLDNTREEVYNIDIDYSIEIVTSFSIPSIGMQVLSIRNRYMYYGLSVHQTPSNTFHMTDSRVFIPSYMSSIVLL